MDSGQLQGPVQCRERQRPVLFGNVRELVVALPLCGIAALIRAGISAEMIPTIPGRLLRIRAADCADIIRLHHRNRPPVPGGAGAIARKGHPRSGLIAFSLRRVSPRAHSPASRGRIEGSALRQAQDPWLRRSKGPERSRGARVLRSLSLRNPPL
jgi:hypothetical protein